MASVDNESPSNVCVGFFFSKWWKIRLEPLMPRSALHMRFSRRVAYISILSFMQTQSVTLGRDDHLVSASVGRRIREFCVRPPLGVN